MNECPLPSARTRSPADAASLTAAEISASLRAAPAGRRRGRGPGPVPPGARPRVSCTRGNLHSRTVFIRVATRRPWPLGRGGNAASPRRKCRDCPIVCSYVEVPAAPLGSPALVTCGGTICAPAPSVTSLSRSAASAVTARQRISVTPAAAQATHPRQLQIPRVERAFAELGAPGRRPKTSREPKRSSPQIALRFDVKVRLKISGEDGQHGRRLAKGSRENRGCGTWPRR